MLEFSPEQLTDKEKKKFLIGSVIPRPIALVSTISDDDIVNVAPFSYFNIVTYDPPMLSVAVQRTDGESKDTARNVLGRCAAVFHIVHGDNVEQANNTSAPVSKDESELGISSCTTVDSKVVKVRGLNEAKVRYETELYEIVVIYNEENIPTTDLLLIKVNDYHINADIYHNGYIEPFKLKEISKIEGNY